MSGWKTFTSVKSPCQGCEDRYPTCHDHCDRYAEYREELMRIREARRKSDSEAFLHTDKHAQTKASAMARKNMRQKRRDNEK